jgi:hypothetical protein
VFFHAKNILSEPTQVQIPLSVNYYFRKGKIAVNVIYLLEVFCFMYDGYIFLCDNTSQHQCLSTKHYTCGEQQSKPADPVREGSLIFLYNTEEKTLLGPFTALTEGGDTLDMGAWRLDVDTNIPSEDIKVTWEDLHIIKYPEKDLPFLVEMKTCKLGSSQTQRVLDLLNQGELYLQVKEEESQ